MGVGGGRESGNEGSLRKLFEGFLLLVEMLAYYALLQIAQLMLPYSLAYDRWHLGMSQTTLA